MDKLVHFLFGGETGDVALIAHGSRQGIWHAVGLLESVAVFLEHGLVVKAVFHIVATSGEHAIEILMAFGHQGAVESNHVGPCLINIGAVGIVDHIGGKSAARTHIHLKRHEIAGVAKAAVGTVEAEELEMHKAALHPESLDSLTAPETQVLVHVLLHMINRIEILLYDVGN